MGEGLDQRPELWALPLSGGSGWSLRLAVVLSPSCLVPRLSLILSPFQFMSFFCLSVPTPLVLYSTLFVSFTPLSLSSATSFFPLHHSFSFSSSPLSTPSLSELSISFTGPSVAGVQFNHTNSIFVCFLVGWLKYSSGLEVVLGQQSAHPQSRKFTFS